MTTPEPDVECAACMGAPVADPMDLCDDHLLASIAPSLAEHDRLRAAADRAEAEQ